MARFITGVGENEVGWVEWRSPFDPPFSLSIRGVYVWWVGVAWAP